MTASRKIRACRSTCVGNRASVSTGSVRGSAGRSPETCRGRHARSPRHALPPLRPPLGHQALVARAGGDGRPRPRRRRNLPRSHRRDGAEPGRQSRAALRRGIPHLCRSRGALEPLQPLGPVARPPARRHDRAADAEPPRLSRGLDRHRPGRADDGAAQHGPRRRVARPLRRGGGPPAPRRGGFAGAGVRRRPAPPRRPAARLDPRRPRLRRRPRGPVGRAARPRGAGAPAPVGQGAAGSTPRARPACPRRPWSAIAGS